MIKAAPLSNGKNITALADRLSNLAETYKADVASIMEDAANAEVDKPGLRRFVSWRDKDPVRRAEQEAIDHQFRFLAGEADEPAMLPAEGLVARAAMLYAEKQTVRQVSKGLGISVGKAQQLKTLGAAFGVHVHVNVNKATPVEMTADDLGSAEPAREMVADDLGDPLLVIDRDRGLFREKVRKIAAGVKPPKIEPVPVFIENDDLKFPAHLDRRAHA